MNNTKKALLVIDFQNDFCEGGSLEVKDASKVLPLINSLKESNKFDLVVLSADWHPKNHCSFQSNNPESKLFQPYLLPKTQLLQMMWPDHCVQGTHGGDFHKDLIVKESDLIVRKGKMEDVDSYSAFGNAPEDTGLHDILTKNGIKTVYCVGLAFDYCVGNTALDACRLGYETYVVNDCTKSVAPESEKQMAEKLENAKCSFINFSNIN